MSEVKKDEVVDLYNTYEEYLNIFITEDDMLYLAEEEVARLIVELGYRSSGTLSREKFFQTKAELSAARNINSKQDMESGEQEADNKEASQQDAETDDNQDVLLEVIKSRFSTNLDNTVNTILFLSVDQDNGIEVYVVFFLLSRLNTILTLQISGFIDLSHRIKKENFLPYLTGQKLLRQMQSLNITSRVGFSQFILF